MKKKKAFLDNLYYDVGKQQFDFFLCGTYEKDGQQLFSKWKKYSECIFPIDFDGSCDDWKAQRFFEQINQRQIFPNEIVLDLETKKGIEKTIRKLREIDCKFEIFSTSSRGFHIHIFFDEELTQQDKEEFIKSFSADSQKAINKTMIALEYAPHWKSKKIKEKIKWI